MTKENSERKLQANFTETIRL